MKFVEAIECLKHGALIRRKGTRLWCWLGRSGRCYYGQDRDYPLQFRDSWLNSEVFADDWEVKEAEGAEGEDRPPRNCDKFRDVDTAYNRFFIHVMRENPACTKPSPLHTVWDALKWMLDGERKETDA